MTTILIRGGTVILPTGRAETNILIKDQKILAVEASPISRANEVIEAATGQSTMG